MSPFCRFLASFSIENDATCAIPQNNEKMKVQYLRRLLIDVLEILQDVRPWQKILLDFKFCCYGNQNQNDCLLLKKKRYII